MVLTRVNLKTLGESYQGKFNLLSVQLQQSSRLLSTLPSEEVGEDHFYINIFNPKKKLVGGAPLHVKRAETPLSTSFFLGLKCFMSKKYSIHTLSRNPKC